MSAIRAKKRGGKQREQKLLGMAADIGAGRTTTVLDLEGCATGFSSGIRILDSIVLKTKQSRFEIVFLGVSRQRGLECYLPDEKNGICPDGKRENEDEQKSIFLKIGQSRKVWECTLNNMRGLSIHIERLESEDPSIIAMIKIHLIRPKNDLSIA